MVNLERNALVSGISTRLAHSTQQAVMLTASLVFLRVLEYYDGNDHTESLLTEF